MVWHVRLKEESEKWILIEYSYEQNDNCDGLLKYDKDSETITIEKMSQGANESATRRLFGKVQLLLEKGELTSHKLRIAIG